MVAGKDGSKPVAVAKKIRRNRSHRASHYSKVVVTTSGGEVMVSLKDFNPFTLTERDRVLVERLVDLMEIFTKQDRFIPAPFPRKGAATQVGDPPPWTVAVRVPEKPREVPRVAPIVSRIFDPEDMTPPPGGTPKIVPPTSGGVFTGTVAKIDHEKGFGFIRDGFGQDTYFRDMVVEDIDFALLDEGSQVEFELDHRFATRDGKAPPARVVRRKVG